MRKIVECIPNFSEGRRTEVIDRIVAAIKASPGAVLLDRESDPNHNRSVITFVATPEEAVDALRDVAGELLRQSPVYQQLLVEFNAQPAQ